MRELAGSLFSLSAVQITRDILWFCVILVTMVVSFAQMFYTLLAPDACTTNEASYLEDKECSQAEYYLKVYAVLLGDFGTFEREHLTSVFSVLLIVFYSFMVVLILLNVLIAVASDSYEKCLIRSQNLFGRARVMMIAELVAFETLLQRQEPEDRGHSPPNNKTNHWLSTDSWARGWSRGSIVFFSSSLMVAIAWVIGEFVGFLSDEPYGNVWMSLCSIFANLALFVGIMAFLSHGYDDESKKQSKVRRLFQAAMIKLLGSSHSTVRQVDDEWKGRLFFLQQEMERISDETEAASKGRTEALEKNMGKIEDRLQGQLTSLENDIGEMRKLLEGPRADAQTDILNRLDELRASLSSDK